MFFQYDMPLNLKLFQGYATMYRLKAGKIWVGFIHDKYTIERIILQTNDEKTLKSITIVMIYITNVIMIIIIMLILIIDNY